MDPSGVYFYSAPKLALDMMELTTDEIETLIDELRVAGGYDFIVVDAEFYMDSDWLKIYRSAHSIVWVSDGSKITEGKISTSFNSLSVREQNAESPIANRILFIHNKFAGKSEGILEENGLKYIGYAPYCKHSKNDNIISDLSRLDFLDRII